MKKQTLLILTIILFVLSACGYRLAGKAELDPIFENTHISYQSGGSAIAELIEKQFEANEYRVVAKDQASAIIDVLYETTDREILSLDEDGKVREYELILRTAVNVNDAKGNVLVSNQEVRLSRDFLFEINELLGKESEQQNIFQEMRADASRLILYRLQAISSEIQEAAEVIATEEAASSQE